MSEELNEINEEYVVDYMPIVRGIVKMSAALNEADSVMDGKYFKFGFKVKFKEWIEVFEASSHKMMKAFMEDNSDALQDAYTRFLEFTKDITIKDEARTDLILLYCKLKSAFNDLDEVELHDGGLMTIVVKMKTFEVLKAIEKQYNDIFDIRDAEGKSIQVIIDQYDELGKAMFVND
jgi:hypothetical protein